MPGAERTVERSAERRGYFYVATAAFTFSLMAVQVKIGGRTLPVEMLMLGRCAVTLVLSIATLRLRGIPLRGNNERLLVWRGLFGLTGLVSWFYAVTKLPLADVTVIHFMHPVLTTMLAAKWLDEKVTTPHLIALGFGLVGTMLVARPPFLFGPAALGAEALGAGALGAGTLGAGPGLDTLGLVAAVVSAIASACAYVLVRRASRTDDPDVIVFYFPLVATPILAPFVLARWVWPTPFEWLLLGTIGLTTHVSQVLLTRGIALVSAGRATTLGYTQVLYAATWGVLLFGERPALSTLLGAFALGVAAVFLLRGSRNGAASSCVGS